MSFNEYEKPADELKAEGALKKWDKGDKTKTTIVHTCRMGYMDAGTEVTVIGVCISENGSRSYDIQDSKGNRIYNVGAVI